MIFRVGIGGRLGFGDGCLGGIGIFFLGIGLGRGDILIDGVCIFDNGLLCLDLKGKGEEDFGCVWECWFFVGLCGIGGSDFDIIGCCFCEFVLFWFLFCFYLFIEGLRGVGGGGFFIGLFLMFWGGMLFLGLDKRFWKFIWFIFLDFERKFFDLFFYN